MTGTDIQKAAALLRASHIVGIPTETVYGLAGNALSEEAVVKIFKAKNRPFFDPLIIHTHSMAAAANYVLSVPVEARKLAEAFWPGPLTLLLPKRPIIPDLVTAGSELVAIRVPDHPLTLQLLKETALPLAAPSANPFGYISPTTAAHVEQQLGEQVSYILDGGPCEVGIESTIIGFEAGKAVILRLGGLSPEAVEAVIGYRPQLRISQNSNPQAPGQLDKHYAPRARLILCSDIVAELQSQAERGKTALLVFGAEQAEYKHYRYINLSENSSTDEAAQRLFAAMRQLDSEGFDTIIAQKLPSAGLGDAINDRLFRASVK